MSPERGFFIGGNIMSWFKRRPRTKEPAKTTPHNTSPMTQKHLKDAKELAPKKASEKHKP